MYIMSRLNRVKISSNSYGQFWYGGNTFPGFYYKKNLGVGGRRSTKFAPGGNSTTNNQTTLWNNYTPGSGVGATNSAVRRRKMIEATACVATQPCGRFFMNLGQNQMTLSSP